MKSGKSLAYSIACFIAALTCIFPTLLAQNRSFSIEGTLTENETGQTITGANVFLANTTIGTSSDESGRFILKNIPRGTHKIVVSHISFRNSTLLINTDSLKDHYSITLQRRTQELEEIVISPRGTNWQNNYQEFVKGFIGKSRFAKKTRIVNRNVLRFDFDKDSLLLKAYAQDILRIENDALGYIIEYSLDHFKIDYREDRTYYSGEPYFIEQEPINVIQRDLWLENRRKAYYGSFRHFINAVLSESLTNEGFRVINDSSGSGNQIETQTLITSEELTRKTEQFVFLSIPDEAVIQYEKENEEPLFLKWYYGKNSSGIKLGKQKSYLLLDKEYIKIGQNGYVYDPMTIIKGGYWSYEKIPYLLPVNYRP